ncbi:MAG: HAD family hydrolase, partial [Pseudomonadota bacterium]
MRAAIFDLDGTLADTSGDLIGAANACFVARGHGQPLDPGRDAATAFRGGRAMLSLGVTRVGGDPDWVEEDFGPFLEIYADRIDRETRIYPGVEAALDRLVAEGWALGVCTNKPEGLAETLLARLGLRPRF